MPHPFDRHFVTVWNPAYADDAMERHLEVLLAPDAAYVWWGKVRSANRLQGAGHLDDLAAAARALEEDAAEALEVQLYLTDYRSLYVADVAEIVLGALPAEEGDAVPGYYARNGLACDCWFRLADIRLLVADDLPGVIQELKALRNVHYHDKPVSLYGGMVDLPLVVTRPDGQRWFDRAERDAVTEGRRWAAWDAEQGGGVAAIERELRDNVMGERAWRGLLPAARRFLASGEKLFRDHRGDAAFDFGPVIGAFAKALEVQGRAVLRHGLARASASACRANVDGRTVDLRTVPSLTLGQLAHALRTERELVQALVAAFPRDGRWFTEQLPAVLAAFTQVRNAGVHESRVDRATATTWRDRVLGVGEEGVGVRLGGMLAG